MSKIARHHMPLVLGLIVLLCLGAPTMARSAEDPADFIRALGQQAIAMLRDQSLSEPDRRSAFRHLLVEYFDMGAIGQLVMGRYWRQATPSQKADFSDVFEDFIVASYASHFDRYDNEQLRIGDARAIDRQRTVVASQMTRTDGMSIDIDWLVKNDGHRWSVIDVAVEGISMVITQRSEFGTVITQRGGIDGLLEAIRQRIEMARLE